MSNKLSYFKRFTRGGQVLSHDISMFRQILVKLINLKALLLFFGLSLVCTYQISTPKELHYAWELGLAKIANQLNKKEYTVSAYKGKKAIRPIRFVLEEPWLNYEYNIVKKNFILSFLGVFIGYIFLLLLIQWFLQRRGKDQARERHLRGAKLGDHQEIKKELKKRKAVSKIKLGGVPIVAGYENRHFFLHGTTGSGKTQCISQLLDYARENNQRAIILDEKGGLIEKFYDPSRDVILNPLDSRSVTWGLWKDCQDLKDLKSFAESLLPIKQDGHDPFWNSAARLVFTHAAAAFSAQVANYALNHDLNQNEERRTGKGNEKEKKKEQKKEQEKETKTYFSTHSSTISSDLSSDLSSAHSSFHSFFRSSVHSSPYPSIKHFLNVLLNNEMSQLRNLLKGSPAESIMSEAIDKTAISVRAVLATALDSLKYIDDGVIDYSNRMGEGRGYDQERERNKNEQEEQKKQKKQKEERGKREEREQKKEGELFSIRDWIADESHSGFLFISTTKEAYSVLRPLISAWLNTAIKSILSLPENLDRRLWLVLDELPNLSRLNDLELAVSEGRDRGLCTILGMQNFAQLAVVYGKNLALSMRDNCNTAIFFKSLGKQAAKWASDELGECEIEEIIEGVSYGANSIRDGVSMNRHRIIRNIVHFEEIRALRTGEAYLLLHEGIPVCKIEIEYIQRGLTHIGFHPKQFGEDQKKTFNLFEQRQNEIPLYIKRELEEIQSHALDREYKRLVEEEQSPQNRVEKRDKKTVVDEMSNDLSEDFSEDFSDENWGV